LDRIDLHINVPAVEIEKLEEKSLAESSKSVRARVEDARKIQLERFKNMGIFTNSEMNNKLIGEFCQLDEESSAKIREVCIFYKLSARGYHRLLKVARTIADLEKSKEINKKHIMRAVSFRLGEGD